MQTAVHTDFILMFLLGLTSSLHCLTMCGPLIAVASAPIASKRTGAEKEWLRLLGWHVNYHLGRGVTYIAIGVVLAFVGRMITTLFSSRLVGGILQVTLGLAIVFLGAWLLWQGKRVSITKQEGLFTRSLRSLVTSGHGWGLLGLGMVTGFLPCGVLYAAFARAVVAGSPLEGGLFMLAFWLGTVPLLLAVGFMAGGVMKSAGRFSTALIVVAMFLTGSSLLYKGLRTITVAPTATSQVIHHH